MQTPILSNRLLCSTVLLATLACGNSSHETPAVIPTDADDSVSIGDGDSIEWASEEPTANCGAAARSSAATLNKNQKICEPTTAARTFTHALCSCEDTNVAGLLHTRSFRSRYDAQGTERLGGSVGVNRNYITGGLADVGGDFTVAGPRDTLFGGFLKVGGDLSFNPAFDVAGLVHVGGDAHLDRSLRAVGIIGIDGDLHRSEQSKFLGLALVNVGGNRYTAPVDVEEPCGCGANEILDVAGAVAAARDDNDNAAIGLDPHALDLAIGIGTAITLPSGRYYAHQVGNLGAIQIRIAGKVELYVADDFLAGPLFAVTLAPDAELDLYVRDNFAMAGAAILGDPARPAATRIYVGGTGDIAVAGLNAFAGNLYAPSANVLVGGVGKVWGSLFGKNILAAGFLDVDFDESIRDGVECWDETPPSEEPPVYEPPTMDPPATEPPATEEPPVKPTTPTTPSNPTTPTTPSTPSTPKPPTNQPTPTPSQDPPVSDEPDPCVDYEPGAPR